MLYLILIAATFAMLVGLVRVCDRIVGSGGVEVAKPREGKPGDGC